MTLTEATNAATRREWRELGFFYEVDDGVREWHLVGSPNGLSAFPDLIRSYCRRPLHDARSEHDHYGPYMYLKIMTWPQAGIDRDSIHGTIEDLERLASLIEHRLRSATPGDRISIAEAFTPACEYGLVLEVKSEGFDPAEADPCLR